MYINYEALINTLHFGTSSWSSLPMTYTDSDHLVPFGFGISFSLDQVGASVTPPQNLIQSNQQKKLNNESKQKITDQYKFW